VRIGGTWSIRDGVPRGADVVAFVAGRTVSTVSFDGRGVVSWDSSLVTFIHALVERLRPTGVALNLSALPDGVQRLVALASARPERRGAPATTEALPLLDRLGRATIAGLRRVRSELGLLGEMTAAVGRFVTGRARVRNVDLVGELQGAGPQALAIVTLTSFLVGTIMAFVGAATLKPFGAGLYVADVVAVAMCREMAAIMTAVIMAGRTGSSYAAQIATMKLTQELDAIETMGIGTIDFIVLPRALALSLMLPLLCVYASFVGIVGGAFIAVGMLDLSWTQYLHRTRSVIHLGIFFMGVGKSAVFGVLIAFLGCRAGLRAGGSAAAVGHAATRAMVSAIVAMIVADGVFAVIFQVLGV